MRSKLFVATAVFVCLAVVITRGQGTTKSPSIDDLISLRRAGSPAISPDGKWVAYTVRETNWEENTYETEIWLADTQTGATRQFTNARKSSSAPAWSPDSRRLAFGSDRTDKRQIYVIDPRGGEAVPLTSGEDSIGAFAWSPDGKTIAYVASDARPQASKDREQKYGVFEVIDQDARMSHLYALDVETKKVRRLTTGAFTVGRFSWSPDSAQIAFDHRINSDPANGGSSLSRWMPSTFSKNQRWTATRESPLARPRLARAARPAPSGSPSTRSRRGKPCFFVR